MDRPNVRRCNVGSIPIPCARWRSILSVCGRVGWPLDTFSAALQVSRVKALVFRATGTRLIGRLVTTQTMPYYSTLPLWNGGIFRFRPGIDKGRRVISSRFQFPRVQGEYLRNERMNHPNVRPCNVGFIPVPFARWRIPLGRTRSYWTLDALLSTHTRQFSVISPSSLSFVANVLFAVCTVHPQQKK